MDPTLLDWYWDIPVITRLYFTASLALTLMISLDVVSAYQIYFNMRQVLRGEVSQPATVPRASDTSSVLNNAGVAPRDELPLFRFILYRLLLSHVFHVSFALVTRVAYGLIGCFCRRVRYCRSLEEGSFRGRTADFLVCLLFGMTVLMVGRLLPLCCAVIW
jgi:Derlin-2/3